MGYPHEALADQGLPLGILQSEVRYPAIGAPVLARALSL